jgi:hypothetical protein
VRGFLTTAAARTDLRSWVNGRGGAGLRRARGGAGGERRGAAAGQERSFPGLARRLVDLTVDRRLATALLDVAALASGPRDA